MESQRGRKKKNFLTIQQSTRPKQQLLVYSSKENISKTLEGFCKKAFGKGKKEAIKSEGKCRR
jgi:hypothetical protein